MQPRWTTLWSDVVATATCQMGPWCGPNFWHSLHIQPWNWGGMWLKSTRLQSEHNFREYFHDKLKLQYVLVCVCVFAWDHVRWTPSSLIMLTDGYAGCSKQETGQTTKQFKAELLLWRILRQSESAFRLFPKRYHPSVCPPPSHVYLSLSLCICPEPGGWKPNMGSQVVSAKPATERDCDQTCVPPTDESDLDGFRSYRQWVTAAFGLKHILLCACVCVCVWRKVTC